MSFLGTFLNFSSLSLHSILYKTKLPFILVFNKTDVESHEFAIEWMHDFETFQRALVEHGAQRGQGGYGDGEPSYMDSLMNSMSLVLDEFYNHLTVRGLSEIFSCVTASRGTVLYLQLSAGCWCIIYDGRWDEGVLRGCRQSQNRVRKVSIIVFLEVCSSRRLPMNQSIALSLTINIQRVQTRTRPISARS